MSIFRARLLKLTLPLIPEYGFTRTALALSVLRLPPGHEYDDPLSDRAIDGLFGEGNIARRALINAWMEFGLESMRATKAESITVALHERLRYNEPVLKHLPEAFALQAAPDSAIPPLDPLPAFKHAGRIADQACRLSTDQSLRQSWYSKRGNIIAIYSAAELHQLRSPKSANEFLDSLLKASRTLEKTKGGPEKLQTYISRSWAAINRDLLC
ncbi:hypothetical protein C8R46DRAFT_1109468 [Mycena filopes]|nr:hypothetical protein C8R46DRAFT_1109468 [Mycena filopes]